MGNSIISHFILAIMKIILLVSFFISNLLYSQKVHVKYLHVRSEVATLYEDLYIDGNKVISRQDSIINFRNPSDSFGISVFKPGKSTKAFYYISNLMDMNKTEKDFFFTSSVNGNDINDNYLIHDNVKKPLWSIDKKSTKTIAGYKCIKATTNFRGSSVTAYFTPDLPYSTGPFKFYGLPGLILDVRVDNAAYNIWKVEKIELDYKHPVNFSPDFKKYTKIEMKDFLDLKDQFSSKNRKEALDALPAGTTIRQSTNRLGVEKVYEWETR